MENPKLALIPSGYKSGKVYSILPTDGVGDFDFTRQSIGTRVNKQGLIEDAKTEGSITNELLYSEDFTQSNWFNSNSTDSISTIVSPNGASLSTLLTSTASNGGLADFNEWSTSVKTASIYVKKNTSSTFRILNLSSASNDIVFNLDSGTVQSIGGNFTGQIISLANGWFRCVGTHQGTSNQTLGFTIPTSGQSVYIWGAMLSEGALSDYIKTESTTVTKTVETFTDVPRLDWLNSDCPSLLLEPQRTNIVYPNTSISAYNINNGFKSDNVITSPDGENNGSLVQSSGGTCALYRSFGTATNTIYNISVFLKKGNYNNIRLREGFTGSGIVVDLSNGTEVSSNNATNKKIEDYGNGWYRVSFNYTSHPSTTIAQYSVYIEGSTASGNTFYTFGGQIEQGSYATSHIKTISNTTTRQKDICINGGDSDLFDITEGTFFVDTTPFSREATDRITLSNNNYNNRILISKSSSTQLQFIIVSNNSQSATYTTNINYNQRNKIIITFKQNEFKVYLNGLLKYTDTSGNIPTSLNDLSFKGIGNAVYWSGKIHDTRVYDRVLTQDEAIELTTI